VTPAQSPPTRRNARAGPREDDHAREEEERHRRQDVTHPDVVGGGRGLQEQERGRGGERRDRQIDGLSPPGRGQDEGDEEERENAQGALHGRPRKRFRPSTESFPHRKFTPRCRLAARCP
jgi:hypothetical protein